MHNQSRLAIFTRTYPYCDRSYADLRMVSPLCSRFLHVTTHCHRAGLTMLYHFAFWYTEYQVSTPLGLATDRRHGGVSGYGRWDPCPYLSWCAVHAHWCEDTNILLIQWIFGYTGMSYADRWRVCLTRSTVYCKSSLPLLRRWHTYVKQGIQFTIVMFL